MAKPATDPKHPKPIKTAKTGRQRRERRRENKEFISARQRKALKLRMTGANYRQIAHLLKCGVKTAWNDVQEALATIRRETSDTVEAVRDLDLMTLDELQRRISNELKRKKGGKYQPLDPFLVDRVLKIMDRRAKYLGLDSPAKVDLTGRLDMATVRKIVEDSLDE